MKTYSQSKTMPLPELSPQSPGDEEGNCLTQICRKIILSQQSYMQCIRSAKTVISCKMVHYIFCSIFLQLGHQNRSNPVCTRRILTISRFRSKLLMLRAIFTRFQKQCACPKILVTAKLDKYFIFSNFKDR